MSFDHGWEMKVWKEEPVSPRVPSPADIDDNVLLFDDKPIGIGLQDGKYLPETSTRAQVATKLLEELDEWIKEEPFSDWLEEKIDLPIFEELPSPECGQNKATLYPQVAKLQPQQQQQQQHEETTQTLLQEFETVLGDVGACHRVLSGSSTLTPPQSPPPTIKAIDAQLLVTLQPVQQAPAHPDAVYSLPGKQPLTYVTEISEQWNAENLSLVPLVSDVARELAVVDELVRSCTEDIAPSSPSASSNGSYLSSEESADDPDWTAEGGSPIRCTGSSSRQRRKPYARPSVEDKKVRKKEQNKNAATRYRQKKKQEIKEILVEERELAEHNEKLQSQMKDLQREIGYLKGLMRDLFRAKGLMK